MKAINKPGCNDQETYATQYGAAAVIISRFWTASSIDEMKQFIKPDNWVAYGQPFWKKMKRKSGGVRHPRPNGVWWKATYEEEVDLLGRQIAALLDITYLETSDTVRLEYKLSPDDEKQDVQVDQGFLSVTTDTLGSDDERTLVEGAKVIRFTDEGLNQLPDLACDGGWVYLMINMALKGVGVRPEWRLPPAIEEVPEELAAPTGNEAVLAAIDREIDDWLDKARESVADHGRTVKLATRRVVGPRYDPRWVGDLLGLSHGLIQSAGMTAATWRRILHELGKLGDP